MVDALLRDAALRLLARLRRHVPDDEQDEIDAVLCRAADSGFPTCQLENGEWYVRTDEDNRD